MSSIDPPPRDLKARYAGGKSAFRVFFNSIYTGFSRAINVTNRSIKTAVRWLFIMTSRNRAIKQAKRLLEDYMGLADGLSREAGVRAVEVPPMRGVDEDMRRWSFYMILEHNTIVNRSITAIVQQLVRGEPLSGAAAIDPKKDVMPAQHAGEEWLRMFQDSVKEHVKVVASLGRLRGTRTAPHMIFGDFDAHKWNCMFSFHLRIHYKQAELVVRIAKAE